jgi:hypothetical protein
MQGGWIVQRAGDRARGKRIVNRGIANGLGSNAGVPAGERAAAADVHGGSTAEMPPASGEMPPSSAETTGVRAAEMAATAKVAAAVAATAVATTAVAAATSCIDRARKRERKHDHGQEIEFRHDNLLKLPSLAYRQQAAQLG